MKIANTLSLSVAMIGMAIAPAFAQSADAATAPNAMPAETKGGTSLTKPQVEQLLATHGYTKVDDLEFDKGLWQAKARSADGKDVDVKVDPATGEIVPDKAVSQVGEDDIRASLATAGYTDTHDVKLDDGVWKAKARNAEGKKVKLQLSPQDGSIIAVEGK